MRVPGIRAKPVDYTGRAVMPMGLLLSDAVLFTDREVSHFRLTVRYRQSIGPFRVLLSQAKIWPSHTTQADRPCRQAAQRAEALY